MRTIFYKLDVTQAELVSALYGMGGFIGVLDGNVSLSVGTNPNDPRAGVYVGLPHEHKDYLQAALSVVQRRIGREPRVVLETVIES